jgi:hypothetical protein
MANYPISIIRFTSGRYGFVGSVPVSLAYVQANGEKLTDKQIETIKHCGIGLLSRYVKLKYVSYATEADAKAALHEFRRNDRCKF